MKLNIKTNIKINIHYVKCTQIAANVVILLAIETILLYLYPVTDAQQKPRRARARHTRARWQ